MPTHSRREMFQEQYLCVTVSEATSYSALKAWPGQNRSLDCHLWHLTSSSGQLCSSTDLRQKEGPSDGLGLTTNYNALELSD